MIDSIMSQSKKGEGGCIPFTSRSTSDKLSMVIKII